MYKFEQKGKAVVVTVGGFFTPDEAEAFIGEYESVVKKLDTKSTSLILDGRGLKASTQEMLPMLQGCMQLYMRDNFKRVYMINFDSSVTNSQVARVAKEIGFDQGYEMISSVDEALKKAI
jgi:hypothetical protein